MTSPDENLQEYDDGHLYSNGDDSFLTNELIPKNSNNGTNGGGNLESSAEQDNTESNSSSETYYVQTNLHSRDYLDVVELLQDTLGNNVKNPEDMEEAALEAPNLDAMLNSSNNTFEEYGSTMFELMADSNNCVENVDVRSPGSPSPRMDVDDMRPAPPPVAYFLDSPLTGGKVPLNIKSANDKEIVFFDPRPQIVVPRWSSPMETKEDVKKLDEDLKEDLTQRNKFKEEKAANYKECMEDVDCNYTKCVTNYLRSIMTKDVANRFNWNGNKGRKGKEGFKDYEMCKIFLEIVNDPEHPKYSTLSPKDKRNPIVNWFRNANETDKPQSTSNTDMGSRKTVPKRKTKDLKASKTGTIAGKRSKQS